MPTPACARLMPRANRGNATWSPASCGRGRRMGSGRPTQCGLVRQPDGTVIVSLG